MSGEGRSLTLESDVDDGVILGLGVFINLHKFFCDKTVLSVCVDAGLHKVLIRYTKPVLIVDTVDECLSKISVVEERLEWEIIFSSFDGCKGTLNDWENSSSSVDTGHGGCRGTCSEMICCSGRRGRQKYWSTILYGVALMWLMPLRSLSNCDYELNFYLRLILGPIHSNQVMGTDPVGSYHGTQNSRSNSINPTYPYQSHD